MAKYRRLIERYLVPRLENRWFRATTARRVLPRDRAGGRARKLGDEEPRDVKRHLVVLHAPEHELVLADLARRSADSSPHGKRPDQLVSFAAGDGE